MFALHDSVCMLGIVRAARHLHTCSPNVALMLCRHCAKAILLPSSVVPNTNLLQPSAA